MKGFIPRTLLGLGLSLIALTGCVRYREIVDPCWPERYDSLARQSVNEAAYAQAGNGHVLDQTVWNYYFEKDPRTGAPSAKLSLLGIERLNYISRRRPAPDSHLYLATAQDIPGLADQPPLQAIEARNDLNSKRIAAVQKYLALQTGGTGSFVIEIHDPAEVGIAATPITGTLAPTPLPVIGANQKLFQNFQGKIADESGTSSSSSSSSSSSTTSSSGGGSSSGGSSGGPPR